MLLQDRFFPRVWDGKRHWYPVYSELGITYESKDLPFCEENIRDLYWVYSWRFPIPLRDDGNLEFVNKLESCVGIRDKDSNLIYEGDIIEINFDIMFSNVKGKDIGFVKYIPESCAYYIQGKSELYDFKFLLKDEILSNCKIIGNIDENPKLIEK